MKLTSDPREIEIVYIFPEPVTIFPTPAFPDADTSVQFRDTGSAIIVLGLDDRLLGYVEPSSTFMARLRLAVTVETRSAYASDVNRLVRLASA